MRINAAKRKLSFRIPCGENHIQQIFGADGDKHKKRKKKTAFIFRRVLLLIYMCISNVDVFFSVGFCLLNTYLNDLSAESQAQALLCGLQTCLCAPYLKHKEYKNSRIDAEYTVLQWAGT